MPPLPPLDPRVSRCYANGLDKINGRLIGSHQHAGVQWMLQREICDDECQGGLLADDCGCGKTYMTACVIAGHALPTTLVISPVSTLHQWKDILTSFGNNTPLVLGPDCSSLKTVPVGTRVVLTTYSVFTPKKRRPIPGLILNHSWDRIILDEGHSIKNQNSVTFANISKLRASIRWVLTATPVQNSLKDLDALARFIGWPGSARLDTFMQTKMLRRTLLGEGRLNPRLRLPKLISEVVRLRFEHDREQHVYDAVKTKYKTLIEHTPDGCKLYTEALQGILRCRQACCHPNLILGTGSAGSKRKLNSSTKFGFICEDIAGHLREKSIIFCMWTQEIALMLDALTQRDISAMKFDGSMTKEQRETTLSNFKNVAGINALVIQIQAGGIGLNLQCATRVYITSPTWNPTHELQAICRSHRLGQEQVVRCFRLIICETIEERMIEIQNQKMTLIADALGDRDLMEKLAATERLDVTEIRRLFI